MQLILFWHHQNLFITYISCMSTALFQYQIYRYAFLWYIPNVLIFFHEFVVFLVRLFLFGSKSFAATMTRWEENDEKMDRESERESERDRKREKEREREREGERKTKRKSEENELKIKNPYPDVIRVLYYNNNMNQANHLNLQIEMILFSFLHFLHFPLVFQFICLFSFSFFFHFYGLFCGFPNIFHSFWNCHDFHFAFLSNPIAHGQFNVEKKTVFSANASIVAIHSLVKSKAL